MASLHETKYLLYVINWLLSWLVVWGLAALSDSISVYIRPSPREREKEERNDRE